MRISDWSSDVCSSDLRELLRRIEEFRARIPRPPEAASYEPSDAEDVLEQQPDVREHFSAAEEPIDDIPDSQWTAVPEVRSEARRGGKECVRTCRSRLSPYH